MSTFSDHNFNAALYREGRLTYGARLFDRIDFFRGGSDAAFDLAIDVGSGTGQVAHSLATRGFKKVVAIEPSAAMRASAVQHPNIKYVDSNSDHLVAEDGSADLVTVAQAIHWFDVSKFLAEAKRVLKPTGVLAIIGYGALYFQKCPEASILLRQLCRSKEKLSPYWPPSNISYVARLYTDIDSFEPLTGPVVHMLYPAPNANGHFGLEEDMYDEPLDDDTPICLQCKHTLILAKPE
ncbi:S-adenosyl-L-methionine-dependent methyltransferase [Ramicandelaber brevisporus]|nr:S-adenosyl-L-methionine-dependent methyltransferase [Ramicandelaber brevisporus]